VVVSAVESGLEVDSDDGEDEGFGGGELERICAASSSV